jgi:hypothetical protein
MTIPDLIRIRKPSQKTIQVFAGDQAIIVLIIEIPYTPRGTELWCFITIEGFATKATPKISGDFLQGSQRRFSLNQPSDDYLQNEAESKYSQHSPFRHPDFTYRSFQFFLIKTA